MQVDKELLLIVESDTMAAGEIDLGHKLMKSFLTQLIELGTLPGRAIFMGAGIFLTTQDSPVASQLRELEEKGCEIFSCITCLQYYQKTDSLLVGRPGTMKDTVDSMLNFKRVLRP